MDDFYIIDRYNAGILASYESLITTYTEMNSKFTSNQEAYVSYIDEIFSEIEFELVLYDEVEYFKNYNHPEFNYPYSARKTKLGTFNLNITIPDDYGYEYVSKAISFQ